MSFTYFISSDTIDHQDPELGKRLMHSFFIKLLEASEKPSHIMFLEKGVQLLLPEFSAVDALKRLDLLDQDHKCELIVEKRGGIVMSEEGKMWQCQMQNCGYIYNPEKGCKKSKIPKDVPFEELPNTWRCPLCGASHKMFKPV
jgi:rubredoxin